MRRCDNVSASSYGTRRFRETYKVSAWDAQFDIQNNLVTVKPGTGDAVRLAATHMVGEILLLMAPTKSGE